MPEKASPGGRRSHWLFRLLGISGWILAIGTFLLCIPTPLGPATLGFTIVSGHSMEPTYRTNDIVVTWRTDDYTVGEPIVYTIPADEPGAGFDVVHRIVDVRANGTFETLGDNNAMPDMWQPGPDDVKGHVFFRIPKLGVVFHPGILPLALAGIAGIFVSMSVWNWLDDGEKDGDDDDPPSASGPPRPSRRHVGHLNALSFRQRLARVLREALRISTPRHARRRPAWRRRVALAVTVVLFGTAGAAHAATLGGIRAAEMFAMTSDATPPPAAATSVGLGAIIEGTTDAGDALDVTNVKVHQGDVLVASTGTFDCNNPTAIDGDLIVTNGSVSMNNNCLVGGSVIAYGNVTINNSTVAVGGDVISAHGNVSIEGATVGGSVKAYGAVSLNNSVKVGGDVIAEGENGADSTFSGSSSSMKSIGGSVRIGGTMSQLALATVGGSVAVAGAGTTSIQALTAAGGIRLHGACGSTCGNATPAPQVGQVVTAPTFQAPPQLTYPTWTDYAFAPAAWTTAGYRVLAADKLVSGDSGCDYQGDAALIKAVDALTSNTLIDATSCTAKGGLNLYAVDLALKASVTFVAPAYSAQQLEVDSADGTAHVFDLITPDATADGKPTCRGADSTVTAAKLGNHISGLAYTPCTLAWGSAGGTGTSWTGQLVAGFPAFAGGTSDVTYASIPLPSA